MGIDVYMKWKGQTQAEEEAQYTGYSVTSGDVGYLREAYHGGPYATAVLIAEDWGDQPDEGFTIPAAKLRERLPAAVLTAIYREHVVYGERLDEPSVVNLPDDKAESLVAAVAPLLLEAKRAREQREEFSPNEEQLRAVNALIEKRALGPTALAFVDFVVLAERMEKETGKPVQVMVSA